MRIESPWPELEGYEMNLILVEPFTTILRLAGLSGMKPAGLCGRQTGFRTVALGL